MNEMSKIYGTSNEVLGTFYNGVTFCKKTGDRLGEQYENKLYNNSLKIVATIEGDKVLSISGRELGLINDKSLFVNGSMVGKYIGEKQAGAGAIAFIFN